MIANWNELTKSKFVPIPVYDHDDHHHDDDDDDDAIIHLLLGDGIKSTNGEND